MRRPALLFSVALIALTGLTACGGKPKTEHGADHGGGDAHAAAEGHGDAADAGHGDTGHGGAQMAQIAHWSYEGDDGPSHWNQLGGDNTTCASGHRQSPINLSGMAGAKTVNMTLDYTSSAAKIQNLGHVVQVSPTDGGGVIMDNVRYKLIQFHFHTPSEHTIDGHRAAIEAHFVHKNDKGELLVIGVLSDVGVADPMLAPIWTYLPTDPGPAAVIPDVLINARDLMPATEEFYAYSGSLTTPPCSENVTWLVYASPLSISAEQVDAYQRLTGPNARPIQTAQGRDILHIIGG
ncbi:carbonic anhydrase [Asticcacaulis sp. YBE204]|uniref:carbonic anhydrase n=1 Tax=Asticcacaulis sp. YBE204 TaxID=1282363 RepID=UPI0003C4094F|nr:carbonic anhydrase family protein [Asticcacaulis sp. YBE204]ESQ80477.1 hypothetical protein AEYBE204_04210 [Asticcacaulis sp. YBE204]